MESIISFPSRGNRWGNAKYRGNCSGYVQKTLFEQFHTKEVTDPMAGSFTTRDVANDMEIISHCYDLSQGFNALTDEIPEEACGSDMWFWHPPYSSVINIPYAGSMWSDKDFERKYGYDPKPYDLGQMGWEEFVTAMNRCMMKFYSAMDTGARMCVLMGDIKRNGVCYSMLREIAQPGVLENIVIKAQHNCVSDSKTYGNSNFIPIVHEYIMILKKLSPYMLDFTMAKRYKLDIRDSKDATWRDVVAAVLQKIGREASLEEIYEEIAEYKRCEKNPHWKEKVRQTLQNYNMFSSARRGRWAMAS